MNYTFKQPTTVLRYLPQEIIWDKKTFRSLPAHVPEWNHEVTLSNGWVRDGALLLHQSLLESLEQDSTDVLLLTGTQKAAWSRLSSRVQRLSFFFNLHQKSGEIWIELCDDYYPQFGSKARDRFDLFPLLPGKSVAIHINARYWHSLAGASRDTHYVENYFFLENLGRFESAELVQDIAKMMPLHPAKEIDLRQLLY